MNAKSQTAPAPPNLISALSAGFDSVANKIVVILFPVALDLFIWFGPHLRLKTILAPLLDNLSAAIAGGATSSANSSLINLEILQAFSTRANLMAFLRSYPVGIPSLMAGSLPIENPQGLPLSFDVTPVWMALLSWLALTVVGLVFGTYYYAVVAQVVGTGKIQWRQALRDWPWASLQVIGLTLSLAVMLLVISLPFSCLVSVLALGGMFIGQFIIILYIGFLLWIVFPMLLSPQGIFLNRLNFLSAIKKSVGLTRLTLTRTGLLFLIILVINEGMNLLWNVPDENSWLILIGILGHAFITSSLLAATFFYYRDADRWVQNIVKQARLAQE